MTSVFMDVEDPINPLADDAALDLARLFTECGVRGSFCLTGEKCRSLLKRPDIRDAYMPHCLGLHTNTHSFHPTTMELLADLSFEEGCEAAFEAEQKGVVAFRGLFGREPAFWGGAGNTWSPEIADALKRLAIPAYVYALTAVPNHGVHRFHGVVALPQAASVSEENWMDTDQALNRSEDVLRFVTGAGLPWVGIFVGHPTRFRHSQYWDTPYAAGRTPPTPEYVPPVTDATYDKAKANLRTFLLRLKEETEIVGVDDALALPWTFRESTDWERHYFKEMTAHNLRGAAKWPIHRPDLDPERIVAKTLALTHTLEIGEVL